MFSAVSRLTLGPAELTVGHAFERRFRLFAVNRRGLTFDSRFAPPIDGSTSQVIVYLILEGTLLWNGERTFEAPALIVMRESDFEGERGKRDCWFTSSGTPFATVDLRIDAADCAVDLAGGMTDAPLEGVADPLLAAARLYLHASHSRAGQGRAADLAAGYVAHLRARGILATDLAATITHDEGVRALLWRALRPTVEAFGSTANQDQMASSVGWNVQRIQREITRAATAFGLTWLGGWRNVVHRYRVRVAVLLLSCPELSVSEIADAVGYSSVEALAHALDSFGLPPARELRRAIGRLEPASPVDDRQAYRAGQTRS